MADFSDLTEIVSEYEPLGAHTWLGLGGSARWFARPRTIEQLRDIICRCRQEDIPVHILGLGANLLVADEGVEGMVIRLNGPGFREVVWESADSSRVGMVTITAGCGVDMSRLTLDSVRRGLRGIECLAGIPGTLGGIIRMNAGGQFGSISEVVSDVTVMDQGGQLHTLSPDRVGFAYRRTNLNGGVVTHARLMLEPDDPELIRERFTEIWTYKRRTQPLGCPSAGCVFKNPPGESAGELIDRAGLKQRCVGGAYVSREHANFIITKEGASSSDVLKLIGLIRREVASRFGVELELEIEIWGSQRVPSVELAM